MYEMRGGSVENASKFIYAGILGGLKKANEGNLVDVSKPDPCAIGEDGKEDTDKDHAPQYE